MPELRLSVIISTRNRAASLVDALRALVTQRARGVPHEIIVVDNGSTDDTAHVIRQFARDYPDRVRGVFEPRTGVSYGRNAGIGTARADLLAFADDDVRADPTWIARIDEVVRLSDADAFGGKVLPRWPSPPPRWLTAAHWSPLAIQDFGDAPLAIDATYPRCLVAANLVVRRAAFARVGLFSPLFPRAQDHEWQLRLWRAGGVARYEPALVVHAPVDPERLRRIYHWRWEARNGRYAARMRLRELVGPDGALRAHVPEYRRILGAPRGVYADLLSEIAKTLASMARAPRSSEAFARALAVRHLAGYLAESARMHHEGALTRPAGRGEAPGEGPGDGTATMVTDCRTGPGHA